MNLPGQVSLAASLGQGRARPGEQGWPSWCNPDGRPKGSPLPKFGKGCEIHAELGQARQSLTHSGTMPASARHIEHPCRIWHGVPNPPVPNSAWALGRLWMTCLAEFFSVPNSAWPVPIGHAVPNSAWNRHMPCRIRHGISNSASHVKIRHGA